MYFFVISFIFIKLSSGQGVYNTNPISNNHEANCLPTFVVRDLQGVDKKSSPPSKVAYLGHNGYIDNQNVDKSFVSILTCVVICKPKQYLEFLVKYLNNRCIY